MAPYKAFEIHQVGEQLTATHPEFETRERNVMYAHGTDKAKSDHSALTSQNFPQVFRESNFQDF